MFHTMSTEQVESNLQTSAVTGLSSAEAADRLSQNGRNELVEKKRKSKAAMFFGQLNDPMIYILFVAAAISVWHHEVGDAVIILAVVLLNATIGAVQEAKAQSSLESLKKMSSPYSLVKRDGKLVELPSAELVTGDVVVLEAGRVIPADLRLTLTANMKVEESTLTGESVPVDKDTNFVAKDDISLGDRINMAYSSTSVAYGRGEGIVVEVGMNTQIGKIAGMLENEKEELTPLQKRLASLGTLLGIAAVIICAAMFGVAVLQRRDLGEMMLTAISLAVAAIPEGLPAVVTIVLAMGVSRMVRVNTIVRKLPSVETLGAVSVVCSDKTGTLTQNKMTVTKTWTLKHDDLPILIEGMTLCNDASVADNTRIGDPTELALLDLGAKSGLIREELEKTKPRIAEKPFDSDRKLMTTVHRSNGEIIAYTKGALDNLLKNCIGLTKSQMAEIDAAAASMAHDALRVLGLAIKHGDDMANEDGLTFVGLMGMIDPPRDEAKGSVLTLRGAGIRTIMITGDHRDTALAIAKELGIAENEAQCISGSDINEMTQDSLNARVEDLRVFARVSPEHKVMIVKAFKFHGYIVSMTGDGVNDAPSLKAADIGVAMGITGTDVAKGAADMVLTDDNFSSIEKAVYEGRAIYANIKKTVLFLLSSNFAEVFAMFTAIVIGLASPLKAIHILWVNLITDSFPALALGVDPKDPNVMKRPPRGNQEGLFSNGGIVLIVGYGLVIAACTLTAFLWEPVKAVGLNLAAVKGYLGYADNLAQAQTYAFIVLSVSQIFHSIGMRNISCSVFRMNHIENKLMILAFWLGLALQIAVCEIPALNGVFGTVPLGFGGFAVVFCISFVPVVIHELGVLFALICKGFARGGAK